MKILELFAGTRSIGKAFEAKGHEVFSVEWDKDFENIDLYADINTITADDILQKFGRPDVIWASPDCATFSIAAISHHRRQNPETGNLDPVSDYAKFCDEVDQHVLQLIKELNPRFYFIENPRGGMRKMQWMKELPRYTVTYCQYELDKPVEERRMKPTDIWTNHPDPQFKPMCKNGDPCHAKAPRGSRTGTQGLKGSKERSVIPEALCQHIVDICEKYSNQEKEKEMELKINQYQLPEKISFNFEEIKGEIAEKLNKAEATIYNDDQIKQAKADRADLNRLKKALNDERIRLEKEYMIPFNNFKAEINEIIRMIDNPVAAIDQQIKGYEEQKKAEKQAQINELFKNAVFPDWVKIEQVFDARWLNATVSMTTISKEMIARSEQIETDLSTLSNLPEFAFEAVETYKTTLDIGRAVNEAHRLSEQAKRKAEYEAEQARRAEEQARQKEAELVPENPADSIDNPQIPAEMLEGGYYVASEKPTEPLREAICFRTYLTQEDAFALKAFFNSRSIPFEKI